MDEDHSYNKYEIPSDFKYWIYTSRILIYSSLATLLIGTLTIATFNFEHHPYYMLYGIRLFYSGVMWAQIPGYANRLPSRYVSIAHAFMELLPIPLLITNYTFWYYPFLISTLIHIANYRGAVKPTKLHSANILTLTGLVSIYPIYIINDIWILAYFPLLSAISLMSRVDPSMRGYNLSVEKILLLSIIAIAVTILSIIYGFQYIAILLGILPLILRGFRRSENIYLMGSTIAKIVGLVSLAILIIKSIYNYLIQISIEHLILIGFLAVIMSSLCIPYLLPGILWRKVFQPNTYIPYIPLASAILRSIAPQLTDIFKYLLIASSILIISLAGYFTFKLLKSKKVM